MIVRLKQFHRLLDIHGSDIARGPARERAAARRLLDADGAARSAHAAALRLAELLARAAAPPPVGETRLRIAGALARLPRQEAPYWWPAPFALWDMLPRWPRAVALASMAALGILVGLTDLDGTPAPASSADVSGLIFDPNPAIGLSQ
ncbi:MAG: hypothetical protein HY060_05485 [Proteobacteria bacterium]|nr:hypothetical protein [Pseudomonadota bacterium]